MGQNKLKGLNNYGATKYSFQDLEGYSFFLRLEKLIEFFFVIECA